MLARRELYHSLIFPRILAPSAVQLRKPHDARPEIVLEARLPNILFGVQVFWELKLRDPQTRQTIKLCCRLHSGHNRFSFPLNLHELQLGDAGRELAEQHKKLLAQFQRGLYHGEYQSFSVRDCFSCLHMRYRVKRHFELAVLSPGRVSLNSRSLPANVSQDPLSIAVQKFAQEGFNEQRPYYPGDDPRRINWKLYSRFNELYVRIPEEQQICSQDLHCYFVPDMACYPKSLRSSVLGQAGAYFLRKMKDLHGRGHRILVHIPGEGPQNPEGSMLYEGPLLYQEQNEETILRALTAYPYSCSLSNRSLSGGSLGNGSLNNGRSRTWQNPLLRLLQSVDGREGPATDNSFHLVFVSPHSLGSGEIKEGAEAVQTDYADYFPAGRTLFLPLPEPSVELREVLLSRSSSPLRVLPVALFWRWLLRSGVPERLHPGSPGHRLYQKLGIPTVQVSGSGSGRNRAQSYCSPLGFQSYPRLLWLLRAWQKYYRQPERRYPVGKRKRSNSAGNL
ncbi:DUF58 domain-containing protein [Candidatus Haliotispira prima]|uniref:DUF58 domain-containing protein n=1 Tax=Candidatus Haliotispira prima TaxID=3034016 RepID=A0ABY8MKV4_9SPIO|nr:DUF58 domain-containing protein [Candidatus Haliotispira prima]